MPSNPLAQTERESRLLSRVVDLERRLSAIERSQNNGLGAGLGSPEGVVVAPVGTLYRRLDGGAGTTLYVKQSGTGNTGWVGK